MTIATEDLYNDASKRLSELKGDADALEDARLEIAEAAYFLGWGSGAMLRALGTDSSKCSVAVRHDGITYTITVEACPMSPSDTRDRTDASFRAGHHRHKGYHLK